jgi:predicted permease
VLLVGAGLLLRNYRRLQSIDLGFDPRNLFTMAIHPPKDRFADARTALALYGRLVERVRAVPGVEEAAFVNFMPLGNAGVPTRVEIPGRSVNSDDIALYVTASEGYLRALRLRLVSGRWFNASDMRSPGDGVVISESVARRYWPHAEALGKSLTIFRSSQARAQFGEAVPSTVIGVVGDLRQDGPGDSDPEPAVYVPMSAEPWAWGTLVVRKRTDDAASNATLSMAVREVEPELLSGSRAKSQFTAVSDNLSAMLAPRRYLLSLLAAFSICALILAAVGIYGVTSFGVAQRTPELGIRRALGAAEHEILRTVLTRGMTSALIGCAIGIVCALLLVRYASHVLADVTGVDPLVLIIVPLILLGTGLAACYLPARRATRVDPMVALRAD